MMDMPEYIRTDEREDAINALEHAVETAPTLIDNPLNWKWVIIAIHNALQGALVCTLSGTHRAGALGDKSMRDMLDWFESSRTNPDVPYPSEWLAPLLELYKRAKDARYMLEFGGQPLSTTSEQDDDIKRLNDLRRGFVHFTSKSWSIESAGLPRIVLNATAFIDTLMLSHPACTHRLSSDQTARVQRAIVGIRELLAVASSSCRLRRAGAEIPCDQAGRGEVTDLQVGARSRICWE